MAGRYRVFGSELSPYSVKVRSFLRYKGLESEWLVRTPATLDEYRRHARLPLIPLVLTPSGEAMQDSTPILEELDTRHPEPPLHPGDPALRFLSALLEEYGDEWVNKPMFHYRWTYEADRRSAGARAAAETASDAGAEGRALAERLGERMVSRLGLVGSSAETRPLIERSFVRLVELLERHLAGRPYLFGGTPVLADFGLAPELYECRSDPTPGEHIRALAPSVSAWIDRMLEPSVRGPAETWDALGPTLEPLLRLEVAGLFLPWSTANAAALEAGQDALEVELEGRPFRQAPQRYHAKSLGWLRARYAGVSDRGALDPILERTGCLPYLKG